MVIKNLALSLACIACCASFSWAQNDISGSLQQPTVGVTEGIVDGRTSDPFADCGCSTESCGSNTNTHYLSVFGGFTDIDNFERTIANGANTEIDGAQLHDNTAWGASIGSQVHPNARCEFEFTYRDNDPSSWFEQEFDNTGALISSTVSAASGTVQSYSGVVNFLFDLNDRCIGSPGLYLGGGLGSIYVDAEFATGPTTYRTSDSSFAYQFIAGLNFPISRRVDLYSEYRFLGADYINVNNATTLESLGDFTFDAHNIFFGARLRR